LASRPKSSILVSSEQRWWPLFSWSETFRCLFAVVCLLLISGFYLATLP
jgi:hypothetical protein